MKIDNPFLSAWGVFWSKTNLFVNGQFFKITCLKGLPLYSRGVASVGTALGAIS